MCSECGQYHLISWEHGQNKKERTESQPSVPEPVGSVAAVSNGGSPPASCVSHWGALQGVFSPSTSGWCYFLTETLIALIVWPPGSPSFFRQVHDHCLTPQPLIMSANAANICFPVLFLLL